jgi:hypothetical protein
MPVVALLDIAGIAAIVIDWNPATTSGWRLQAIVGIGPGLGWMLDHPTPRPGRPQGMGEPAAIVPKLILMGFAG